MCLILLAWDAHPDYRLIVAANRDEFYARPTAPAAWWPELPGVLAGRDLEGGGTWLGVDRKGRWAALTNFRDPADRRESARSRGLLVRDYLAGEAAPIAYLEGVAATAGDYRPFNLLVGTDDSLAWYGSRGGPGRPLVPGLYGLSNALLDTDWPKVSDGKRDLAALLARPGAVDPEALFALLADGAIAPDDRLPATGVSLEWERRLSARFIRSPDYGTRSSTLLLVGRDGSRQLIERSFPAGGVVRHDFSAASGAPPSGP